MTKVYGELAGGRIKQVQEVYGLMTYVYLMHFLQDTQGRWYYGERVKDAYYFNGDPMVPKTTT